MSTIDTFIAEIQTLPTFAARAATDRVWSEHLAAIEFALNEIDRRADSDPQMIEIFDRIENVIARRDVPLKQRLLEMAKLLVQARDAGKITH